jgi:Domain of unknown function (DUF1083).
MRKVLTLILAALMVATASTISAFAQSTETSAAITAAYGTPVIDGVQDDIWSTTVVQDVKLVDKNVIPSESKTTGTVRVLWDNDYLYFFITVDKAGVKISSGGGSENTDDCADVCFTMNGNFTGSNNVPSGDEYAGVFRTLLDGTFGGFGDYQTAHIADFKGAMKQTSDSTYNSEYAIPWEDVKPTAGYVMGMDIQINDATDGARTGLINWAYVPCYGWRDSMYHGMVTLLAQAVETTAPVAETEAAATETPATDTTSAPATGDAAVIAVAILGTCCAAAYVWSKKKH